MRTGTRLALAAAPVVAGYSALRYRNAVRQLDALPATPPDLPGRVRSLATDWGRISYRLVERGGDETTPVVLVHGWGRTGDSAWWPVFTAGRHTTLVVDLPGHGRSILDRPFTFSLAAETILAAIADAGLQRPMIVGHSMGGPVGLTTVLWAGAEAFAAFVGMATSAYWVRPRQIVTLAAAPYLMGPRAPGAVRAQRHETRRTPDEAGRIAWEYAVRPPRQVLMEAAVELRRFDARRWRGLAMPPTTWVVTARDGIIEPAAQRDSARLLGANRVELPCEHSLVVEAPGLVTRIIDTVAERPEGPVLVAV
jgi:pimeloyl-ACP methyl ester carboxylesterase